MTLLQLSPLPQPALRPVIVVCAVGLIVLFTTIRCARGIGRARAMFLARMRVRVGALVLFIAGVEAWLVVPRPEPGPHEIAR